MGNFGPMEMLVIAIFGLLVFGPQKLPEMARTVARAVKEFKKTTGEFTQELQSGLDLDSDQSKPARTTKSSTESKQKPDHPRPGPR